MILNKWKKIILILLAIILIYTIGFNSRHRRYIDEDKEQFLSKINDLIIKSKVKMDDITSNKDEVYIEYKDIELLMMYHDYLDRSVFGFKKKVDFVSKDISTEFQSLWDKYKYEREINLDGTREFYENLLNRSEGKEAILLDDDVYMLGEIYILYDKIRKDITKFL